MAGQRIKFAKRRKTTAETTEEQTTAPDRISDLPDEILIKILTAADLDTKTVIQTSAFSRIWRNLWKSVLAAAKLSFDFPDGTKLTRTEQRRFAAFVDRALSFLDKEYNDTVLSVTVNHPLIPRFSTLLDRIFAHGARTRNLKLSYNKPKFYFSLLEAHTSKGPQNLNFSTLTMLRLYRCVLRWKFNMVPNLTDLEVIECELVSRPFTISGDKLVRIVLVHSNERLSHNPSVEIRAPNLKSFTCKGLNPARYTSSVLRSLECLDIDVRLRTTQWAETKKRQTSWDFFRMFRCFCRAERVMLHPNAILALTMFPDVLGKQMSPFKRMQRLELPDSECVLPSREVFNSLISYFFGQSPRETTHFDRIFTPEDSNEYNSLPIVVRKGDLMA